MSRLSRARRTLREYLQRHMQGETVVVGNERGMNYGV